MHGQLYKVREVIELIENGELLVLAGDKRLLDELPSGNWIGGTTPYFAEPDGLRFNVDKIFVRRINNFINYKIKTYDVNSINDIVNDSYNNGYTILVLPPFTDIHYKYALEAKNMAGITNNPITGWVAAFFLNSDDIGKVYNGLNSEKLDNKAVALHVELPDNKKAEIRITNIYKELPDSPIIEFDHDGFDTEYCFINGEKVNFVDYIKENNINTRFPLVTETFGMKTNISFKNVKDGRVFFYAPFFKNKKYKFTHRIDNYIHKLELDFTQIKANIEFSCNCILNYVNNDLLPEKLRNVYNIVTFGEIAYILLNQTMVNLVVIDK